MKETLKKKAVMTNIKFEDSSLKPETTVYYAVTLQTTFSCSCKLIKLKNLVKALLKYKCQAQLYFKTYKTEDQIYQTVFCPWTSFLKQENSTLTFQDQILNSAIH